MSKKLKYNLNVWLTYSIGCYIVLLPFKQFLLNIPISIILGFLFGMLNDILTQLRKLNGEKFDNIDK